MGLDIGVLWACFEAFGESPPGGVVVMGYLAGTLGNVLRLPGGLGGKGWEGSPKACDDVSPASASG